MFEKSEGTERSEASSSFVEFLSLTRLGSSRYLATDFYLPCSGDVLYLHIWKDDYEPESHVWQVYLSKTKNKKKQL